MEEQFRRNFNAKIVELSAKKDCSSSHLTGERYAWIIRRLKDLKQRGIKKAAKDYRLLKKYEVVSPTTSAATTTTPTTSSHATREALRGEQVEKLQKPNTCLQYVSHDDLFDVVRDIHVATGHGARDVMRGKARKRYANVTKEVLQLYIDLCEECQEKKTRSRKAYGGKPCVTNAIKVRGDVQLIDMQTQKDEDYQFILKYEDLTTGFVWLRPLRTKRAEEVANHLTDIFCTFGSPYILQTDNGREFTKRTVKEVKNLWPACVLVHGARTTSSNSQGDSQKKEIESLVTTWMRENQTNGWAYGLRFVQWQTNNMKHGDMKRTPYSAMFYEEPRLGVNSISLIQKDVVSTLETEEELKEALSNSNPPASSPPAAALTPTNSASSVEASMSEVSFHSPEARASNSQQRNSSSSTTTPSNDDSNDDSRSTIESSIEVKRDSRLNTPSYNKFESDATGSESKADSGTFSERLSVTESLMDIVFQEQDMKTEFDNEPTPDIKVESVSPLSSVGEMFPAPSVFCGPQTQRSTPEDMLQTPAMLFDTTCSVCEFACTANLKCVVCNNFCHEKPPCSKVLDPESKSILCLMCEMKNEMESMHDDPVSTEQDAVAEALESPMKKFKMSFQYGFEAEPSSLNQGSAEATRQQDQPQLTMLSKVNEDIVMETYKENAELRRREETRSLGDHECIRSNGGDAVRSHSYPTTYGQGHFATSATNMVGTHPNISRCDSSGAQMQ